ncbi:MAG: sigma-B regulation protein RsbU (phosphoserine phosphatase) [Saprospiraceae bacterium]|jgi:sigma-B regulation protein RsbU (phosphoserine phosphatase)
MAVKSLKRAQERIEIKDLKLDALLEVTLAINSNVSKTILFSIYEKALKALNIEKLVLFTGENDWGLTLSYGIKKSEINLDVFGDLMPIKSITEVNHLTEGPFSHFDTVIPVFHKNKALAYLLIGDIINEALKISPIIKHFSFIQTFTNIIVVALENKSFAREALRQEGIRKELELASDMQNMLLPSIVDTNDEISISAYYQSHQEVGGDYYDIMWLDERRVAFCIADVSGKGISAAILMSNFQANVRVLSKYSETLEELVITLNQKVVESANGEKFITMFIGLFDLDSRELSYINCGHNPPVLKQKKEIQLLSVGCPGLGMLDDIGTPVLGKVQVEKGALLSCYTDGLVEVENSKDEEFGSDRVSEIIDNFKGTDAGTLNTELIVSLNKFKKNKPFVDDIAILSCYFW